MKTIFSFIVVISIAFFVYDKSKNIGLVDIESIPEVIDEQIGGGDSNVESTETIDDTQQPVATEHTQEEIDYFNAICRGSEYGGGSQTAKWKSDVKVYVMGEKIDYLTTELKSIVAELNSYINPINITFVNSRSEANFIVLFGSASEYVDLEPYAADYVDGNWGLFVVNSGPVIYDANMFVDIERCQTVDGRKHLLREEFTQALGFKRDSYEYPESIFQQNWTTTTEYAPIDVAIIKMLYNE